MGATADSLQDHSKWRAGALTCGASLTPPLMGASLMTGGLSGGCVSVILSPFATWHHVVGVQ